MRFRISHLLLMMVVAAIAIAVNPINSTTKNTAAIPITAFAIAPVVAAVLIFLGSSYKSSIVFGTLASALVWSVHVVECLMLTPSTELIWRYVSADIFLIIVPIHLLASLVASAVSAYVASLILEQG